MQKVPYGKYTKEFREYAVKLVVDGGLSIPGTFRRLSLPKSTIENWILKYREGLFGMLAKTNANLLKQNES